jgi:hypothetical protein
VGKKRYVVALDRVGYKDGKDVSFFVYLIDLGEASLDEIKRVDDGVLWTSKATAARRYSTQEGAERVAFMLCAAKNEYLGKLLIFETSRKGVFLKVRRREVPPGERNLGRWPNSTGRRRRS